MNKQPPNLFNSSDLAIPTKQDIAPGLRPRFYSTELFGNAHEIVIEHAGEEYRLRLTRQGKLILTK
jgi:hemin uptake protein HemP